VDRYNLVSFAGLLALMFIAWALSSSRRRVNVRCVAFGVGLQLLLGVIVFWAPGSREVFLALNDVVGRLFEAASAGQVFLFGNLGTPGAPEPVGPVLAFQALPVIVFFAALMALLYHWRVMPLIVHGFAWVFTRLMRVSGPRVSVPPATSSSASSRPRPSARTWGR
jgi:CNT family concentrative nucleoside transporter